MGRIFGFMSVMIAMAVGIYLYAHQAQSSSAAAGVNNPKAAIDITGVRTDLMTIAQAERGYFVLQGKYASKANAEAPIYRGPLLPVASASSVGTVLGLGRAAKETFLKRLPDRKITYTGYSSQREAPLTHHQVADAALKIDEAEFHALRLATLVDTKGEEGSEWKLEERARARADMGAVVKLSKEAVDILTNASGGSSIYNDVPIQKIHRDITAANLHALMHPDTNNELYGRVLVGLEPNTLYI